MTIQKNFTLKTNELRIGNLISFISTSDIEMIVKIDKNFINDVYWTDLHPILITEEWLLRFEFEWSIFHQGWWNGKFKIVEKHEDGWYFIFGNERIHLKSVHQLQNLYFALTDEELTIVR
jgi:hypothetical protein